MRILEWAKGFIHLKTFAVSFSISLVWILGTDFIVHRILPQQYNTELLQNMKGVGYVLVLSLIMSWLHKRELRLNNLLMAQKKQSMLGEFSGMIVHEVKNPLHSLQICTSRLNDLFTHERIDGKRYVTLMEESLIRLNDTIDFLQTLSRGGSVDNILKTPGVNPTIQLEKVFTFLSKSFLGMRVRLETQDLYGVELDINESLMGHVFLNLIKNAMEYMRDQGIEDGEIRFTNQSDGKNIIIGMSNSGAPISADTQLKMFEHYSSKEDQGGTGLGLIFCRQIMKAHGGRIEYDSTAPSPKFLLYFPNSLNNLASSKRVSPT